MSSGWPARMMRSTFSLVVSTPESMRISSSTRSERFCASSTIRSTLRPAAYCSMRKLFSVLISSALRILNGEKPNCTSTACRKSIARDLRLVDLRDHDIRRHFLEEGLDQRGFARADLAGDHHEAVGEPDGRLHVRLGACMLFRQVQELRVRAEPERQFLEFEGFEVHGGSRPMLRDANVPGQILEDLAGYVRRGGLPRPLRGCNGRLSGPGGASCHSHAGAAPRA